MLEIIILIAGVLNLIMGIVALLGRGGERQGRSHFAIFSMITFAWALCVFFIHRTDFAIFVTLSYSLGSLFATFLMLWAYHFSFATAAWKFRSFFIYLLGLIFAVLPFLDGLVVFDVHKTVMGDFISQNGPLYLLYTGFFLLTYLFVSWSLIEVYRLSSGEKKSQAKTILTGFAVYGILTLFFGLILPIFNYNALIDFDVPCSLVFIASTSYAIAKYRWMNIKVISVQLLSLLIIGMALTDVLNSNNLQDRIYHIFAFLILTSLSYLLVRSVMNDLKRKEQLQKMSNSLALANDQLRKLDNMKTDFINMASHQLKKVPTPIKGYLSLLLDGSYGEIQQEQRKVLENINSANERQINLVDDLLNVVRLESGRVELNLKKHRMEDICQEVYTTLLPNAKEKGLVLEYEEPRQALPELMIDRGKIFEAIFNFVDNAIKYTSNGKVDLKVELASHSNYKSQAGNNEQKASIVGPVIRVTVSDTGAGISKENLPYLFSKFSRKDSAHLNNEGTGLGLYVVKLMIEAHDGRTWAESDGEGKGSRFIIELPVKAKQ